MRPGAVAEVGGPVTVVVLVVAVAAVPLRVRADGLEDIGNHPVVVVPMAVATVVLLLSARRIRQRSPRLLLGTTGLAMLGYLLCTAALAWHGGRNGARDGLTELLVAVQGVAWAPPITLLTLTFLVTLTAVRAAGARVTWLAVGLAAYSALVIPLVALTSPPAGGTPYDTLPPLVSAPALHALGSVLLVPWMLSILLGPALAWRAVARAPSSTRERALVIAVAAMVPPVTMVVSLSAALLSYVAGVLNPTVGALAVSLAFHLPFVIAAPVLVRAVSEVAPAGTSRRAFSALLTASVGLPLLVAAATIAWLAAERIGTGGLALVVLTTLGLGAVVAVLQQRAVRSLVRRVDPVRTRTLEALRSDGNPSSVATASAPCPAAALQDLARRSLLDPGALLSVHLPDGRWVHADGRPAPTPAAPTSALAHLDPTGSDAATVLDAAEALVDRAVLELSVRAQEAALTAARQEAEDARAVERTRLERDLHDGVQGRLLALALDLRVSQRDLPPGAAHQVITDAVEALGSAIEEVRALAHGDGPELLSRQGLRVALADFTRRVPIPVTVVRAPDRLPPVAEAVVYLVVCEAVTNALKHARADAVEVDIAVVDGIAVARVTDDGVGGADLRAGAGLRGLSERVDTAGGRLLVSDRDPHGTLLEMTVPCGS